ncbi:transcriptional regulator, LysR family [Jannaschia faecimaris]|uniref:Transcriptional regulator, LysR family n=1 Tax=Jannaschia faecimaris TaxID=1244108 RepID=A0A1H3TZY3_9RHOB|nr:LysR substrate-binding domain-containing protein [Jannaschia faecimaris]SDZ55351.1 transcriptional regulator, LysR family [Jannaschia faecimaris]
MSKLPPLNALKAFEAAARHEGFVEASEELHVSRGAISRHVKILEEHLGVQLFVRHAQGVALTTAGSQLLPVLTEAFGLIAKEAARLATTASELRVICPPGTSIRWLIPKLEDFRRIHPEIRLKLTTDFYAGSGFDPTEADVGFSVTNWPNRKQDLAILTLFPARLTPMCTADYRVRTSLQTPEDLAKTELLHETKQRADWAAWINAFMLDTVDPTSGHDFPNIDMATKAALMGVGVVMGDLVLCREELESGALIAPFPDMVCDSPLGGVCLLGERDKWSSPKVEAFKSWAYASAAQDLAAIDRSVSKKL